MFWLFKRSLLILIIFSGLQTTTDFAHEADRTQVWFNIAMIPLCISICFRQETSQQQRLAVMQLNKRRLTEMNLCSRIWNLVYSTSSVYPCEKYITGLLCSMFHQMAGIILKMIEAFQKAIERMQQTMKGTLVLHPFYLFLVRSVQPINSNAQAEFLVGTFRYRGASRSETYRKKRTRTIN